MIDKIKKYFTEKPKGNIWKRVTYYLILFRYLGVYSLLFIIPLLAGLAVPGQEMDFYNASQSIAVVYDDAMTRLYDTGSNIALNNPILSKCLLFALANFIYLFYVGFIFLVFDIIRHITSWAYGHRHDKIKLNSGCKTKWVKK